MWLHKIIKKKKYLKNNFRIFNLIIKNIKKLNIIKIVVKQSERRRKQEKIIKCMRKLYWISLGVSFFYKELQKIFMDDHPQVTIVVQNLIFYNTPPRMIIRICLIKTLLGKTLLKEKDYNIFLDYYNCLVKNLTSKTQWALQEKMSFMTYIILT